MRNKLLAGIMAIFALQSMTAISGTTLNQTNVPHGLIIKPISDPIFPKSMKEGYLNNVAEEKKLGYIYDSENNTKYLFGINENAKSQIKNFKNPTKYGVYDTHIKKNYKEIKLSFPFKGIGVADSDIIGYAAIGSYHDGWDSVRVFFNYHDIGVCSFSYMHHDGIVLVKESVEYAVNQKPTTKSIIGNPKTGFVYHIHWDTDAYQHHLECPSMKLDNTLMNKMIMLANKIDKYIY